MNKKIITAFLFFISLIFFNLSAQSFKENLRMKYNFNSNWLLQIGDIEGAEKSNFNDSK